MNVSNGKAIYPVWYSEDLEKFVDDNVCLDTTTYCTAVISCVVLTGRKQNEAKKGFIKQPSRAVKNVNINL